MPKLHVIIIGGGIGGLAAAIAIQRAGHQVTPFEKSEKLCEVRSPHFSSSPTDLKPSADRCRHPNPAECVLRTASVIAGVCFQPW